MAKLWEKGYRLDGLLEAFTVGDDWQIDSRLVAADCTASIAHAVMLRSIGFLTDRELNDMKRELLAIIEDASRGTFAIAPSDEDCHTAIENRLVATLGDTGKKIHTGRSRNDQVLTALRLWTRDFLLVYVEACVGLALRLLTFAEQYQRTPMVGRTHMQPAMPSSVGLWAAAHAEEVLDAMVLTDAALHLIDSCPLGSAASYGVPLPLDRELVAKLLGFDRVQNNVLYANNSRGKFEGVVVFAVEQVCLTLARMAEDLILFSMPEFQWFTLPSELCSGSSLMPQKRNPDVLELMRAKAAVVGADLEAITSITRGLPSGYNRDFQLTKAPFFRAVDTGYDCVRIMDMLISRLRVNTERLEAAFTPEVFATDKVLELVSHGLPFRDAYRSVAGALENLTACDPAASLARRTSTGTPGNLHLEVARSNAAKLLAELEERRHRWMSCIRSLTGREVSFYKASF